ncbi:apses-domain-containing protein [Pseudovirgaria hyperparasitica]|uniref:Apses-domain-containing protein n=1 Tax=Pseudovirgaria hyperparasitica TaxID=470096 RepID=A0A6A6W6Q4_9PEZI|nr:apses-domain-containing protein [Pseudovirgaria hyperparasitica]KAF2758303.1 apses-domain-containing protein [Pseudovirgaria hyperparasitica]
MSKIYSATYSNVPVYEFNADGNHIMRRRGDDWINATHILKVADYDKPARTRILEREVQKGIHEKVQGGYGKYQGTWIPLLDGRALAERNGVLERLLPIFDFVPGDRSPPPAPKHATAAASKPKARQTAAQRRTAAGMSRGTTKNTARAKTSVAPRRVAEEPLTRYSPVPSDGDTIVSESLVDDVDVLGGAHYSSGRRQRRGEQMSLQDQQHQIWADGLLDYFMLLESEDRFPEPPEPPMGINLDHPIDEKGHTAMHWAAAMGDVGVVRDLIQRGATIDCMSMNQETPLMRAVMFTNNYDKLTMPSMVKVFSQTVVKMDWFGSTVFHHIAATTSSSNKYVCARYYCDCILDKLSETWNTDEIARVLNQRDQNGDTAILIAARNGARKCVRSLLGRNADACVPNNRGEMADHHIKQLNARRRQVRLRQMSSSPFAPDTRVPFSGESQYFMGSTRSTNHTAPSVSRQFRSQTASHMISKILPTIMEKCEQLAAAYEAELEEKEVDLADAERVVQKRQAEIDALRQQTSELENIMVDHSMELEASQEEELNRLIRDSEALLELEQKSALRKEIAHAEQRARTSEQRADDASSLRERFELAILLHRAQEERRGLVKDMVCGLSAVGMGERTSEYKRLLTGALGVKEDDLEAMVPEILGELEETQERDVIEEVVGDVRAPDDITMSMGLAIS